MSKMKVYFNASLAGKEKYQEEFKTLIKIIKELEHDVYADHIMNRDHRKLNKQTKEEHEANFQKARNQIQKSDVMIVEATYPSIGVGYAMTIALEMYKSVLVLCQTTPHGLLIGDPNRLLTVKKYKIKNREKLKDIIKMFLKKSESRLLKKRFNFMIDQTQEEYLEWVSKKQLISKSNFIRQLVDESLKNNKEYSQT